MNYWKLSRAAIKNSSLVVSDLRVDGPVLVQARVRHFLLLKVAIAHS